MLWGSEPSVCRLPSISLISLDYSTFRRNLSEVAAFCWVRTDLCSELGKPYLEQQQANSSAIHTCNTTKVGSSISSFQDLRCGTLPIGRVDDGMFTVSVPYSNEINKRYSKYHVPFLFFWFFLLRALCSRLYLTSYYITMCPNQSRKTIHTLNYHVWRGHRCSNCFSAGRSFPLHKELHEQLI